VSAGRGPRQASKDAEDALMVTAIGGRVVFGFYRPDASQVSLVGDFNAWRIGQLPMRRREDGYWIASVRLPPGTYRFRYVADGRWFCDFAAFGVEYGPFGPDGVVEVPTRAVAWRTG